ncbi:MAG: glutamate-5-semialdehyde dehydrogenase [Puniceicoccales bacterium]|jgi:glutamate-5-semialdehyde dehydrogenase|nr:glutamate-5-semialdehyde dehydrogenase [Puniceicoccales bacterium]
MTDRMTGAEDSGQREPGDARDVLTGQLTQIARQALEASRPLATASAEAKNAALRDAADALEASTAELLAMNARDIEAGVARGLSPAMLDRLRLTPERVAGMVSGIRKVAGLPDPVGVILREWTLPNGLLVRKRAVPIGVIGIIYESRPNVTADAAALCFKSGNATVLRGGSEAFHSNAAIARVFGTALGRHGFAGAVTLVPTTDRAAVPILCSLDGLIDVLIPRGGRGLIETVVRHARVPVIKHYDGICHVFVHRAADFGMAERIVLNAKCQRPGVCNAMETLLVDGAIAPAFVPRITAALHASGVEIRADDAARLIEPALAGAPRPDWGAEYLAPILNLRVVENLDAAVAHITKHGSRHSDSIVTGDHAAAEKFLGAVDSAAVYWNASTRFTDGGEFGFGAEIGISTGKLHARGPMGLEELTTWKYQILGSGQVRG